ncbi:hypothetical protein COCCU_04245 [Corynebacterium occultum]|uniref:DUF1648 domain-containing protein n=1 Tax=Corynebacterium occultum TaxID=2675219 RepID=A0A6B8W4D7_9CORY|nr:DUF1648 domain-containing protein [Corynebacterium occultum]QGU06797.1 hypothetical protein COCCU_04245 [Corynebacterium occultum]
MILAAGTAVLLLVIAVFQSLTPLFDAPGHRGRAVGLGVLAALLALTGVLWPDMLLFAAALLALGSWGNDAWARTHQPFTGRGEVPVFAGVRVWRHGEGYWEATEAKLAWSGWLRILALFLGGSVYLLARWEEIPQRFATHFGSGLEADAWSEKSLFTVLMMPLVAGGIALLFLLIEVTLVATIRNVEDPEGVTRGGLAHQVNLAATVQGLRWLAAVLLLFFLGIQFTMTLPGWNEHLGVVTILGTLGVIGGSLLLVTYLVGASSKVQETLRKLEIPEGSAPDPQEDEKNFRWGVFYHNSEDPRVMVEKRHGLGMDFNYATWQAKAFMMMVALILLGSLALAFL